MSDRYCCSCCKKGAFFCNGCNHIPHVHCTQCDGTCTSRSILNSWGKSNDAGQLRSSGITRDGMFKMQTGLAGVGTPDATYAESCYPADGTKLNLQWDRPWERSRRRYLTPRQGDKDTCYSYTVQKGDTVGGIADHFGLDMRQVSTGFRYYLQLWKDQAMGWSTCVVKSACSCSAVALAKRSC
jgi:hypothetical protein